MTEGHLTPWSQLDDEAEERREVGATSIASQGRGDVSGQHRTPEGGSPAKRSKRLANVSPNWALAPLAAAGAWVIWGAVSGASGGTAFSTWQALCVFALILSAAALLFVSRAARKAAIAGIHAALTQNSTQARCVFENHLPLADEFKPLWGAVKLHTANIEERVSELLEGHKQMGLELSLAETGKRRAEVILTSISDPILVTDAFDQLTLANPAAEALFGIQIERDIRKPVADVIDNADLVKMIQEARRADSRAANRRVDLDISKRAYALTMTPLTSGEQDAESSSRDHGNVVLLRDITKEREGTRNKSEFVAHAAHEMRTPLSSIRAYVEMLVDGEVADEKMRVEYYNIIQGAADRLGRMIDNMLNISRIEAGTVRINKEPVAVSMVVKEAIDLTRPQADKRKITLTEELTPVAYRIMADRDMIYQAVLNLLSNAIKYTPEGGEVHVRMTPHEENRTIRVEVRDTGVGIPAEDLPRMFEKFFRVEANKKMAKGTGLGLNLVKNIVETIHDGKMTLDSKVGKGSTFGIVLPLTS